MLPVFYHGLVVQLGCMPADFWINKSLHEEYVSFRGEIEAGLSEIFGMAHQALTPEVQVFTPRTIYRASNSMNAAFAGFAGKLLGRDDFARPYRGTEFEAVSTDLRKLNTADHGYRGDRDATDAWAGELGVAGWYEWRQA